MKIVKEREAATAATETAATQMAHKPWEKDWMCSWCRVVYRVVTP